jgi:hypothetical protein
MFKSRHARVALSLLLALLQRKLFYEDIYSLTLRSRAGHATCTIDQFIDPATTKLMFFQLLTQKDVGAAPPLVRRLDWQTAGALETTQAKTRVV